MRSDEIRRDLHDVIRAAMGNEAVPVGQPKPAVPWARSGRPVSPRERLDERLAAGEISVEEHLTRRSELEQRS